jgi:hypothetical protein
MIVAALLSFVLLLIVVYLIAAPFLAGGGGEDVGARLSEERGRVLAQIRDLDMEFQTGKLSDGEYQALRARRLAEVQTLTAAIAEAEEVEASEAEAGETEPGLEEVAALAPVIGNGHGPAPAAEDDDLERAIAARRRSLQTDGCPKCEGPIDPDDAFCRRCGADLGAAQTR